jgi:hypothetical protein
MHKRSKRVLIGMAIVVVALVALYVAALARSSARLRQVYAALEQNGRPMKASDVIPPEVPDAENAALLYESAVAMLKAQPVGDKNLLEYLGNLSASVLQKPDVPDKQAELKELMAREVVARALTVVEQGTCRPACRFRRDWSPGRIEELPIVSELRHLEFILGAKAYLEARAGDVDTAWATIRTQIRVTDAPRCEPLISSHCGRARRILSSCETIRKLCAIAVPDPGASREIENLLRGLDDIAPFVRALDSERLLIGEWLFGLPEEELYKVLLQKPMTGMGFAARNLDQRRFQRAMFRPRFATDHARYLELMSEGIRFLEGPYEPKDGATRREVEHLQGGYLLTSWLAPWFVMAKATHCEMSASVQIMRAGLALLRYRHTHGAFPDALDALELEGLIDPYPQKPLCYRNEGQQFVVYSIGNDLTDNGGKEQERGQLKNYDVVWRFSLEEDRAANRQTP